MSEEVSPAAKKEHSNVKPTEMNPARPLNCFLVFAIFVTGRNPVPKLFLIGDSISIHYSPFLEKYLQGVLEFDRKQDHGEAEENLDVPKGANGGDSRMVLACLKSKTKGPDFQPDFLLLNCGLHDIKTDAKSGKNQVGKKEYKENLIAISDLLRKKGIQLIWIRTTPVVDNIHNRNKDREFWRYASDLTSYNEIADNVFEDRKVPVIDLHHFTQQSGPGHFIDHVHYNESTRALQAEYIAGFLNNYLAKQ